MKRILFLGVLLFLASCVPHKFVIVEEKAVIVLNFEERGKHYSAVEFISDNPELSGKRAASKYFYGAVGDTILIQLSRYEWAGNQISYVLKTPYEYDIELIRISRTKQ